MKVQNANNSAKKTKKLIQNTFLQLLSEKKKVSRISVSALAARANISRATFYTHFDDIYGVVESFEEELIELFFSSANLLGSDCCPECFDAFFSFLKENDEKYKMFCQSDDVLFSAGRLTQLAIDKFTELAKANPRIEIRTFTELDISILLEGFFFEYIKYCRGRSAFTPDDLRAYAVRCYLRFSDEYRK